MALTKEDLQSIGELMDGKLEPINVRLDKVDSRLDKVDSRLDKADTRFDAIEARLDTMQDDISSLKADMVYHNHTIEPQLKLIMEGIQGMHDHYRRIDIVEARQEDHGQRIFALEQVAKAK